LTKLQEKMLKASLAAGIGAANSLHGLGECINWQRVTLNEDLDAV
jgi:hypothetical protein